MFRKTVFLNGQNMVAISYGTLKSEIVAAREAEKDAILEIEVKGALQIQSQTCRLRAVFLSSSSPHPSLSWRNGSVGEKQNRKRNAINALLLRNPKFLRLSTLITGSAIRKVRYNTQFSRFQAIIAAERSRIDTKLIETIPPLLGIDKAD